MTSMISYIIHNTHLRMPLSLSPSHLTIIYLEDSEQKTLHFLFRNDSSCGVLKLGQATTVLF